MDLRDKVAIVTGGDRPAGRAIASALGDAGCKLVVTGFEQEPLDELKADLEGKDYPIAVVALDLTQEKEFDRLFNGTITTYGALDIVVNNYGQYQATDLISDTSADMIAVFEQLLYPVYYATKWAVEVMMETGGGTIVNVGSAVAYHNFDSDAAYSAAEYALRGFSLNATGELAEHNIAMSLVSTAIVEGETAPDPDVYKGFPIVKPDEVAAAVAEVIKSGKDEVTVPKKIKVASAFKGLFR
ncbi:MAG: SDR family NAD(P)-dependent oxidoreductase [bacterium]|nr:SDR family NAD(P)-dependent oxidoreductase [bacterium]